MTKMPTNDRTNLIRQLADMVPSPFYWLDLEQHYLGVNTLLIIESGAESFEKNFLGKTPFDVLPEKMARIIVEHHKQVIKSGETLVTEETAINIRTKEEKYYKVNIAPLFDDQNTIIGTYGISIDSTKENKLTQKLRNDVYVLRQFADMLPEPFYWLNLEQYYLGVNLRGFQVTGTKSFEKDFAGKTPRDLYPKAMAEKIIAHHKEVIEKGEILCFEEAIRDVSTQQYKVFKATIAPLRDYKGHIIGTCGISIDITREKQLTEQLMQSKEKAESASRSKSEFIANMSHDIRTPITGILAMADHMLDTANTSQTIREEAQALLADSSPATHATAQQLGAYDKQNTALNQLIATVCEDAPMLSEATKALLNLCNDILEVVQLESGKTPERVETFDVKKLLEQLIRLLRPVAKDKQLELSLHLDSAVPCYLTGARLYLERILLNLTSNALKFTDTGIIKISVSLAEADNLTLPLKSDEPMNFIFSVEDTGMGIPADKQEVIFEHFSRLTSSYSGVYKGSGLGLYTVKRYVEAMQGKIQLNSTVGKGSCFIITLPFKVGESSQEQPLDTHLSATTNATLAHHPALMDTTHNTPKPESSEGLATADSSRQTNVLVVEDTPIAAIALKIKLQQLQCEVDIASNGTEALQKAESNPYDCIFMDIGLPDFTGIEATKKIRALSDSKHAEVPIFAVTGHAGNADQRKACFDAGMQAVLNKPAELLELESALKTYTNYSPHHQKK